MEEPESYLKGSKSTIDANLLLQPVDDQFLEKATASSPEMSKDEVIDPLILLQYFNLQSRDDVLIRSNGQMVSYYELSFTPSRLLRSQSD